VLVAALLLIPAAASGTTLYPSGDTISFSNVASMTITGANGGSIGCQMDIPSVTFTNTAGFPNVNNDMAGDVQFRNCGAANGITTVGSVLGPTTFRVTYGKNQASLVFPQDGLAVATSDGCTYANDSSSPKITGYWGNGYGAPVDATTMVSFPASAIPMTVQGSWNGNCPLALGTAQTFTFDGAGSNSTLTDTTNPSDLPLLGP
jgi:hypothetical protein